MIHEKTLETIAESIVLGPIMLASVYIAIPLTYYTLIDLAKLYFKKENQVYKEKASLNSSIISGA